MIAVLLSSEVSKEEFVQPAAVFAQFGHVSVAIASRRSLHAQLGHKIVWSCQI